MLSISHSCLACGSSASSVWRRVKFVAHAWLGCLLYFNMATALQGHLVRYAEIGWTDSECRFCFFLYVGRDSSVGIATRYGLDGPGIGCQWGARFSGPVQTGPGAHPASYTMGTGSFPGVKRPGGIEVEHPLHLTARLKREYSYTLLPPLDLRGMF